MAKHFAETCSAESFLNPDLFRTEFDNPAHGEEQYRNGLRIGNECEVISIGISGVWGGTPKTGGSLSSYERIGYHANTADLLRGFLASGARVHVYRWKADGTGWEATRIK